MYSYISCNYRYIVVITYRMHALLEFHSAIERIYFLAHVAVQMVRVLPEPTVNILCARNARIQIITSWHCYHILSPPPHSASYNIAATATCASRVSAPVGYRKRPPAQVTAGPGQHTHHSHHHMCQKVNSLNG